MIRPQTLFFIHGKISKKSKTVYRVRNNRQQCYTLNHSTPDSEKQLLQQTIFKLTIKIINKELANPEQNAYWQNIASLPNIKGNTARKAAYAHHSQLLTNQQIQQTIATQTQQTQQIPATLSTTTTKQTIQNTQPTHSTQLSNKINNKQLKSLTLISHLILRHIKTEHYNTFTTCTIYPSNPPQK